MTTKIGPGGGPFRLAGRFGLGLLVAGLVAGLVACGQGQPEAPDTEVVTDWVQPTAELPVREQDLPLGQLGEAVIPTHYALDLEIDPVRDQFAGRVTIDVRITEPVDRIYLHGRGLQVSAATLTAGQTRMTADYAQVHDSGVALLTLPVAVSAGQAQLELEYQADFSTTLDGLYKVVENDRAYAFTQFEAISARLAFPGFDEPRFKVPFDLAVSARPGDVVITSTPVRRSETTIDGAIRHVFETTPPLPTYLIAFAVGPFDMREPGPLPANAVRDIPLPFRGVAAAGKGPQLAYALDETEALLTPLEAYFGSPHPYPKLDIIAAPDFAFGAMENVGAIIYREQLLLLDAHASLGQQRSFGMVHAHELAHQWFGNLVTPAWWDDIWLNEAFATWMAYKAADAWRPDLLLPLQAQRRALDTMATDSLQSTRQIRQPITSNDDILNAFDGITYRKGGAVLSMFERFVGETAFREGVRLHMERHAHGVATAEDFMQSIADGGQNPDVVPAFRSFLEQPGVPLIETGLDCADDSPTLTLRQSRYRPLGSAIDANRRWQVPVCVAALSGDQREQVCHLLTEPDASIPLGRCPEALLPNAGGAGYYRWSLSAEGWTALLQRLDQLTPAEQLSLIDSLDAGFRAGVVPFDVLANALPVLAQQPNYEVATRLSQAWAEYQSQLVDAPVRAAMKARLASVHAPQLSEQLGLDPRPDESANTASLRGALARILVEDADAPALRAQLAQRADAYIGPSDGAMDLEALSGDLIGPALQAGVIERGAAFAQRLWRRFDASTDAILRQRILKALSRAPQADVVSEVQRRALGEGLRSNEVIQVLREQFETAATRAQAWDWLRQDFEAIRERLPDYAQDRLVETAEHFCSESRRAEVVRFFEPRVDDLMGAPRAYAQTLERIDLCLALREARAEQIAAVMAAR